MNAPAHPASPASTELPPVPPVMGLPPALKVDRLVSRLIAAPLLAEHQPATGTDLASTEPARVIERLVQRRGGVGGVAKRTASVQRVAAAWLTYGRRFAPGPDWVLAGADIETASLLWASWQGLPSVVDVVCAGGLISRLPDSPEPSGAAAASLSSPGFTVRVCDLVNPTQSRLHSPAGAPAAWESALNPSTSSAGDPFASLALTTALGMAVSA